ncbi:MULTISPECIES: thiamine phosphate synthase [unclassified Xanthobacter]|uniref:thiamine phosphate synthase n=1 Tax=unclassified Xanthobacter TaxID=2623496 RepID=UPI001EDFA992|nr:MULTISPECIES: thiamine phosphate synthase [unclassified Xanthobacter]
MLPRPPLLVITDRSQARGDLADIIAAACAAGCRWFSLREKDLPQAEQIALFARLRAVTRPTGATLTLHGPATLAAAAGADGVHLSAGSDPAAARALLGPGALIGLSTHTRAEATAADPAHLDYITLSPLFPTPSKPGYGPALGLPGLTEAAATARVPVIALGGITAATATACRAAGAAGVAVMGSVMRAGDVGREVRGVVVGAGCP